MKKLFYSLLFASISITASAQNINNREPYLVKSLAGESIKNVQVTTSGGSISVSGGSAAGAKVEVYVTPNNMKDGIMLSKEEIRQRLEANYDLNISVHDNTVTATAKPKERNMDWKRSLSISFKINVPANVSTELTTSGGSIRLDHLSGNQEFHTSGGSLHVENMSGKVRGRTSGGSIYVANSTDDIDLGTSGGSIRAENCTGDLKLATSGGSLDLSNLKGNIKANTSGGSINASNIEGALSTSTSGGSIKLTDLACSLETSTSGGHIDVSIKQLSKFVKINNSGGNIDLQIPKGQGLDLSLSANKVKANALNNFNGRTDENRINGTLNGGGLPVTVSAGSGTIRLTIN
jgi:Putative adhesin